MGPQLENCVSQSIRFWCMGQLQAESARSVEALGSLLFFMDKSHKFLQLLLGLDFVN